MNEKAEMTAVINTGPVLSPIDNTPCRIRRFPVENIFFGDFALHEGRKDGYMAIAHDTLFDILWKHLAKSVLVIKPFYGIDSFLFFPEG